MRERARLSVWAAAILAAGLLIRFAPILPEWLGDAGGGALYVCLVAVLFRLVAPHLAAGTAAWLALGFTCLVECSQLLDFAALRSLRSTFPGRLVLGSTFSWWDFPPYTLGAVLAAKITNPPGHEGLPAGSRR